MSASFRKWDVVLLTYPFSDLSSSKVRPAVVVSPDTENGVLEDGVFLLITSNTARRSPYDLVLAASHPEFAATGLLKESAVRINKVWTLSGKLVSRKLGQLGAHVANGSFAPAGLLFRSGKNLAPEGKQKQGLPVGGSPAPFR